MKFSLGAALAISLSLASCAAKSAPMRLTVRAADNFSGTIHLIPCLRDATDPVVLDEGGAGQTSACPYGDLELVVIEPSKTVYIEPENISIERSGDGIPVTVTARVP